MRIALIAPLVTAISQPYLGGSQAHVAQLAQELQRRGHQVTLLAREGSAVPGINIEPVPVPDVVSPTNFSASAEERYIQKGFFENFLGQAQVFLDLFLALRQRQPEFELIHAHAFDWQSFAASCIVQDIPVIHTLHLPAVVSEINDCLHILERRGHLLSLVTVSHACARTYEPYTSIDRVIYNGLDLDTLPFSEQVSEDAPLLVAGRIAPEKGIDAAIAIAERSGKRLVLAGGIYDQAYYSDLIAPLIERSNGSVSYVGHLEHSVLWKLMSKSQGLLFPIAWDEPFGLSPVEAMATGTPVIAYERGATSEIIQHGKTGFLVPPGDIERAVAMVAELPTIARRACRRHVEAHFSQERMLDQYEEMYLSLIEK